MPSIEEKVRQDLSKSLGIPVGLVPPGLINQKVQELTNPVPAASGLKVFLDETLLPSQTPYVPSYYSATFNIGDTVSYGGKNRILVCWDEQTQRGLVATTPGSNFLDGRDGSGITTCNVCGTSNHEHGSYVTPSSMSLVSKAIKAPKKSLVKIVKKETIPFDSVVLAPEKKEEIQAAISQIDNTELLFTDWGFSDVFEKGTAVTLLFYGIPGGGKCHGKGTEIKLYSGEHRKVERIKVDDLLMGDDNKPRKVLSLARGKDDMYRITPNKYGEPFTVNKEHIMVLRSIINGKEEITEIALKDLLKNKSLLQRGKLIHTGLVEYPKHERKAIIDPYWLGLWLGDGDAKAPAITTMDQEVVNYIYSYAKKLGLAVVVKAYPNNKSKRYAIKGKITGEYHDNKLIKMMDDHFLREEKHIPYEYLHGPVAVRRELLAGILDSDGHRSREGNYDIIQKNKYFMEEIVELARSLGYSVSWREKTATIKSRNFSGTYYRAHISNVYDLDLNMKVKRKLTFGEKDSVRHSGTTGFTIDSLGRGDYYGFTLDGNSRYLLKDFTITHNTLMAQAIAEKLGAELKIYGMAEIGSSEPGGSERFIKKIFEEAKAFFTKEKKHRVVLFDECDALLYDRNKVGVILGAQINTLLTEIERHDGIIIFTTNRIGTLDPALERRIAAKIEFPFPTREQRVAIWKRMIPDKAPIAKDVDFEELAKYPLAGGNIKNAVLNAARMAAYKKQKTITMDNFLLAIEREAQSQKAFESEHDNYYVGGDYVASHTGMGRKLEIDSVFNKERAKT